MLCARTDHPCHGRQIVDNPSVCQPVHQCPALKNYRSTLAHLFLQPSLDSHIVRGRMQYTGIASPWTSPRRDSGRPYAVLTKFIHQSVVTVTTSHHPRLIITEPAKDNLITQCRNQRLESLTVKTNNTYRNNPFSVLITRVSVWERPRFLHTVTNSSVLRRRRITSHHTVPRTRRVKEHDYESTSSGTRFQSAVTILSVFKQRTDYTPRHNSLHSKS